MKLLLSIPHFNPSEGGAEAFAATVMREMARRGHQLRVVAEDGSARDGVEVVLRPLGETVEELREFCPDLHLDWGLNIPADLHRLGGGTHREYLRMTNEALGMLPRLWGKLTEKVNPKHRRYLREQDFLLSRPNAHFLANSRFVAAQARAANVAEEKIHVLHNGVDVERFAPVSVERRTAVRKELGLAEDEVAFLMSAHNLKLKNFSLLAKIFPKVLARAPQAKLLIMGKHAPRLRVPWLRYLGAIRDPERIYTAADALLHPTFFDACANVLLEASACGIPVVSSDRNGSGELLNPGVDGLVLPVVGERKEIERQWSEAVCRLALDSDYRRNLGRAARRLAERDSISEFTNNFEQLLNQIVEARNQKKN